MNAANCTGEMAPPVARRFRNLILERTGMLMGPCRRDAMVRAVLAGSKAIGQTDPKAYYRRLQKAGTESALWENLVAHLATGETYFFRDANQVHALDRAILPELIARHRRDRRLRIWSAGCASGEEPYTIAILLQEMLADIDQWQIFLLATDINKRVLQAAGRGLFREWSLRRTDPAIRSRYFSKQGDAFELSAHIRKRVTFAYLNLCKGGYPGPATRTHAMDLILYRNVAIYQPESIVKKTAGRFYHGLVPGGWLMVGAAETSIPAFEQFSPRTIAGTTVFRKPEGAPSTTTRTPIPKEGRLPLPGDAEPAARPAVRRSVARRIENAPPAGQKGNTGPMQGPADLHSPRSDAMPAETTEKNRENDDAILRMRAGILSKPADEAQKQEKPLQFIGFALGKERFGIEIGWVREVRPLAKQHWSPVPCTPDFILGLANVRGRIHPIMDMGNFFDLPPRPVSARGHLLLVRSKIRGEGQGIELGLLTDDLPKAVAVPRPRIQPVPDTFPAKAKAFLRGVTEKMMMVVDIERLLSDPGIIIDEEG